MKLVEERLVTKPAEPGWWSKQSEDARIGMMALTFAFIVVLTAIVQARGCARDEKEACLQAMQSGQPADLVNRLCGGVVR